MTSACNLYRRSISESMDFDKQLRLTGLSIVVHPRGNRHQLSNLDEFHVEQYIQDPGALLDIRDPDVAYLAGAWRPMASVSVVRNALASRLRT
jgi:hypothetical protein